MTNELRHGYEKALEIYQNLQEVANNDKSFVEILTQCENRDFVHLQFKLRIGNNPFNKELWKYFITWHKYNWRNVNVSF